jgi:cystathionine beta-lyase/cystathionine gamma-synthase
MDFDLSYILNHLGEHREDYLNSVAPPIFQTAMFASPSVEAMRLMIQNEQHQPFYTRGNNPTVNILREKMAALEGTEDALIFASGAASIAAAVMANVRAGDHIVSVQKPYSWTRKLLQILLPRFGVELTYIDGTDARNFEKAIQTNTKVLFLETPNSWTYEQQDLEAVGKIAKAHNLVSIVDNSYATPLYQQPARYGIDIMTHSATKYIGGHSDTVAGVLCASREMTNKIFAGEFMTLGGVISPFNAWLLLRGLRTLEVRLDRVSQTTAKVIQYLENHPRIEQIWYPYHAQNPQYDLSKKQMKGGAGMFTIAIKASDMSEVEKVCNNLKRFLLAVSWGAYESLAFPACALYGSPNYPNPDLEWNRVRMCIGLEAPEVLIADLEQALATI